MTGTAPPPDRIRFPRELLERYRPLRVLGAGGMGAVVLVQDLRRQVPVAIKLMRDPENTSLADRLQREAEVLGRIDHPNILKVELLGLLPSGPYLVMEYVEGTTLDRLPPGSDVLGYLLQVASGLEAIHAQGLVHRDLKPANILITREGRAVLGDFGLAAGEGMSSMTRTGAVVGTANFLCPEAVRGDVAAPPWDWYAWGISLYVMCEGRFPYEIRHLIAAAAGRALPDPEFLRIDGDGRLAHLVRRMIDKDPDRRPANREEIEELLRVSPGTSQDLSARLLAEAQAAISSSSTSSVSALDPARTAPTREMEAAPAAPGAADLGDAPTAPFVGPRPAPVPRPIPTPARRSPRMSELAKDRRAVASLAGMLAVLVLAMGWAVVGGGAAPPEEPPGITPWDVDDVLASTPDPGDPGPPVASLPPVDPRPAAAEPAPVAATIAPRAAPAGRSGAPVATPSPPGVPSRFREHLASTDAGRLLGMEFSRDGSKLFLASHPGSLAVLDIARHEWTHPQAAPPHPVPDTAVAWTLHLHDDLSFATALYRTAFAVEDDHTARVVDLLARELEARRDSSQIARLTRPFPDVAVATMLSHELRVAWEESLRRAARDLRAASGPARTDAEARLASLLAPGDLAGDRDPDTLPRRLEEQFALDYPAGLRIRQVQVVGEERGRVLARTVLEERYRANLLEMLRRYGESAPFRDLYRDRIRDRSREVGYPVDQVRFALTEAPAGDLVAVFNPMYPHEGPGDRGGPWGGWGGRGTSAQAGRVGSAVHVLGDLKGIVADFAARSWSPDGRWVADISGAGVFRLRPAAGGAPAFEFPVDSPPVHPPRFSADGATLAVAERTGVTVLGIRGGRVDLRGVQRGAGVHWAAPVLGGGGLALHDEEGLELYRVPGMDPLGTFPTETGRFAAHPAGAVLLVFGTHDFASVRALDARDGRVLARLTLDHGFVHHAAFSPAGDALALATLDGEVFLVDLDPAAWARAEVEDVVLRTRP